MMRKWLLVGLIAGVIALLRFETTSAFSAITPPPTATPVDAIPLPTVRPPGEVKPPRKPTLIPLPPTPEPPKKRPPDRLLPVPLQQGVPFLSVLKEPTAQNKAEASSPSRGQDDASAFSSSSSGLAVSFPTPFPSSVATLSPPSPESPDSLPEVPAPGQDVARANTPLRALVVLAAIIGLLFLLGLLG